MHRQCAKRSVLAGSACVLVRAKLKTDKKRNGRPTATETATHCNLVSAFGQGNNSTMITTTMTRTTITLLPGMMHLLAKLGSLLLLSAPVLCKESNIFNFSFNKPFSTFKKTEPSTPYFRTGTGMIQYILKNSEPNIFVAECGVGTVYEPNTIISFSMTDGFTKYYFTLFRPNQVAKIEADLPYALMSVWTSYTGEAKVITGIRDDELVLKDCSPNPYVDDNEVMASKRSYTLYAGKDKPKFFDETNMNFLTTENGLEMEIISLLVFRVVGEYGDESGLSSGEFVPKVTLIDENGNEEFCNFFLDQGGVPSFRDTYFTPNSGLFGECFLFDADEGVDFSFYPLAETEVALANSADGAYVIALTNNESLIPEGPTSDTAGIVVEFKNPPRVFDPEAAVKYDYTIDARFTSLCLYAPTGKGNKCISGIEIYKMFEKYGVAYVAFGPEKQEGDFKAKGIPFLPILPMWKYFLYRVQFVYNEEYDLELNLPKWDGATCDDNTFNGYYKADNQDNLGDKAPVGKTCESIKLREGCGFQGLEDILSGLNTGAL